MLEIAFRTTDLILFYFLKCTHFTYTNLLINSARAVLQTRFRSRHALSYCTHRSASNDILNYVGTAAQAGQAAGTDVHAHTYTRE